MPSRLKVHKALFDKTFAADNTSAYYLSMQVSSRSVCLAVFNPVSGKYIAFKSVSFTPSDDLTEYLNLLLEEDPWLKQAFSKVFLLIDNPFGTLVPPPLFDEDKTMLYLEYNYPVDENYNALFNRLKTTSVVSVFGILPSLESLAKASWKDVRFYHSSAVLIESLLINFKNKADDQTLFLNVRNGGYDLVYYKENKLHFHNFFRYKTKEDFIYFLLVAIEELHLNPEQINLKLLGDIDKSSVLYEMIYRYIRNSSFLERNDVFGYSFVLDELMIHKHYVLFNVLSCE